MALGETNESFGYFQVNQHDKICVNDPGRDEFRVPEDWRFFDVSEEKRFSYIY